MEYEIIEIIPAGNGYDLKRKVLADGNFRYLYYAEMPDRSYFRGWNIYENSTDNYIKGMREPCI